MSHSETLPQHQIARDGACGRRLEVQIPSVEVETEIASAVQRVARKVRLPGFRKGRVPARLIRQRYARDVEAEAVETLAGRHVAAILESEGLHPVASPVLDKHTYRQGGALELTVRFDVEPSFELGEYRNLPATRPASDVSETEVDEAVESIRHGMARVRSIEGRPAAEGDDVSVNLVGSHLEGADTGKRFERQDVSLIVGTEDVHPDLSGALAGARVGEEREVTIRYPDEYRTPALAGRTIRYELQVAAIRERELPELGDDMAQEAGDFATLDELRAHVRNDLEHRKTSWADKRVRDMIVGGLLDRNRFEVPRSLVEQGTRRRLESLAREMAARGLDPEKTGIDWREEWDRQAGHVERDLRTSRILDAIADAEAIDIDDAQLTGVIDAEARRTRKTPQAVQASWHKEGRIEAMKRHLRRERVLDFLVSVGHIQKESE